MAMTVPLLRMPAIRELLDRSPDRQALGKVFRDLRLQYTVAEITAAAVAARGVDGADIARTVAQAAAKLRRHADTARPIPIKFLPRTPK
jgi:hypothetical protein